MPLYFFDTDNGECAYHDDEGQDVAGAEAARQLALVALTDMADDRSPIRDSRTFTVRVRDARDRSIYSAELALRGEWLIEPAQIRKR